MAAEEMIDNVNNDVAGGVAKETEDSGRAGNSDNSDNLSEKTPEELASMIKDLRKENAAKRIRNREDENKLKEFEEWKRSQMTEAEKLRADLEKAKAEKIDIWREALCEKYDVPEEDRDLVNGSSKEEMDRLARKLGKKTNSSDKDNDASGQSPNLFPGVRGKAVGSTGNNGKDFDLILREKLRR
jgi:hypothetical protein